jgi:hypothetical protein
LRKKAKGSIIDVTRRSVLGFGLEELHLAPTNRVSGYSSVLLRRLKLLLLSGTSVSCCLAEGDIARVMLYKLACDTTLSRHGDGGLVCAGGLRG